MLAQHLLPSALSVRRLRAPVDVDRLAAHGSGRKKRIEGGREGRKKEAQRNASARAIAAGALLLMLLAWM